MIPMLEILTSVRVSSVPARSATSRCSDEDLIGKIEIEKLLSERREQLGESFTMKRFMDEFNAAGLVPASLLRWDLTGRQPADVRVCSTDPPRVAAPGSPR